MQVLHHPQQLRTHIQKEGLVRPRAVLVHQIIRGGRCHRLILGPKLVDNWSSWWLGRLAIDCDAQREGEHVVVALCKAGKYSSPWLFDFRRFAKHHGADAEERERHYPTAVPASGLSCFDLETWLCRKILLIEWNSALGALPCALLLQALPYTVLSLR